MLTPIERRLRVPDRRRVRPPHAHRVQRSRGPLHSYAQRCPCLFTLGKEILILTVQKRTQACGGGHIVPCRDRNQAATKGATVEEGLNGHDSTLYSGRVLLATKPFWTDYVSAFGAVVGILVAAGAFRVALGSARDSRRSADAAETTATSAHEQLVLARAEHEQLE